MFSKLDTIQSVSCCGTVTASGIVGWLLINEHPDKNNKDNSSIGLFMNICLKVKNIE